ncbi:MAG: hypothetical protein QNK37_17920 [Acidobacteriota bacterium]|nr:hypothetical protein [Acidobacteriota bacterium]
MKKVLTLISILSICTSFSGANAKTPFSRAWDLFLFGDLDQSWSIVEKHLGKESTPPKQRADLKYLKAHLLAKRGETDEAVLVMTEAKEMYEAGGRTDSLFYANLGLAKFFLDKEETDQAAQVLESNRILGEREKYKMGYLNYLRARLALLEGNYEEGLFFSEESYAAYKREESLRGQSDALAGMGLFLMLTGKYWEGMEKTQESRHKALAVGDANKFYYIMANAILYARCYLNKPNKKMIRLVKVRIARDKDDNLKKLLEFVQNCDCAP